MSTTKSIILSLCVFLLAACAPSPQAIQTAIGQTQAANPTSTFTIIQPTSTPRLDITSVLLANGFLLGPLPNQGSSKHYQIITTSLIPDLEAIVYDDGIFSIIIDTIGDAQNAIVRSVLLAAYGSGVANWVAPVIEGKDFSQTFEQNGTAGGYNINISIAGLVGWRTLKITIMPVSQ